MKSEEATPLQIEFDLRTLEYYSYLRTIVEANQISYWIGNPSVEIVNGSIHLQPLVLPQTHAETYQDYLAAIRSSNIAETALQHSPTSKFSEEEDSNKQTRSSTRSRCLILCGIPNSKSPAQIIENSQLGEYRSAIIQIRVIKTTQLKYYGMLLLFKNRKASSIFFNDLFGREYNQIEMQRMVLREMAEITLSFSELIKQGERNELKILRKLSGEGDVERIQPERVFMSAHFYRGKPQQMKEELAVDRLVCTICLQQISGEIISILCGHYFHCQCLERWQFNTCPLCRYHQQPPVISFCEQCNQCEGLWVCLICGRRLCCGVQNDILAEDSHIYQHYRETKHSLSMELQTKFIFDARVPAFLHQMFYQDLIHKGVGQAMEESQGEKQDIKKNKLSDKIALYENQVAEEMHRQRNYFQEAISLQTKLHREEIYKKKEKTKAMQKESDNLSKEIEELSKHGEDLASQLQVAEKQDKIVTNLVKIYAEKAQKSHEKADRENQLARKRIAELEHLIQQKKGELLNYKNNLILQDKIKGKLKGQTVEGEIFFMGDKPKKNKKK